MKTLRLIAILAVLSQTAFSQTLPPPLPPPPPPPPPSAGYDSKADSLFNEGNIREAVAEYQKIYRLNPGDRSMVYNYACALSRDGQIDSAQKYLNIAMNIEPVTRPLTDPDLLPIRESEQWADFENNLITLLNKKSANPIKDADYAKALWKIQCMDQYCFYETILAVRKLGSDSPVVSALRRLQKMQNQKNLEQLEPLLQEKGWPKRSQVGPEAAGAAFFVLQHSDASAQEKYLPMFEKCCRENEANWQQYALMFDRMRMNMNLPQKYGTHSNLDNRATGESLLYPLEDETKVDEWRKEIGLEPLKDYLKRTNIKYVPSTQKK
jgi:tetratricopeptide (TPR) repeat protein